MLKYPAIDPVAFSLGPVQVHWYGLMYIFGIAIAWLLARKRLARFDPTWTNEKLADLVFYCALGVIVGGRLGYILFYDFPVYAEDPIRILQVWKGGMSFHGGMVGVLIALFWTARQNHKSFFELGDFIAPLVPIGLGLGRIGNFINGELWGNVTKVPWAMVPPKGADELVAAAYNCAIALQCKALEPIAKHPSQLYQAFLEGLVLFVILWIFSKKQRPTMAVSGMFLLWYGIFRFVVEFVRAPDPQLGYLAFGWLTMGQLLCVPMIIAGAILLVWAYHHQSTKTA